MSILRGDAVLLASTYVRKHKDAPEVKCVLKLSGKERLQNLNYFVKMEFISIISKNQNQNQLMCSTCKGFYEKKSFFHHRSKCQKLFKAPVVELPVDLLNNSYTNVSEEFTTKVLATMINDEIGLLGKKDQFLLIVGNRLFSKIKRKEMDTVKTIRANICRLAHLYHIFKQYNIENRHNNLLDMFESVNFEFLRDSISEYTVVEGQTKKIK